MNKRIQNGVILPSILWITTLILVIATSFASDVQVNTRTLDNIKGNIGLKYDANSGIYIAIERLLKQRTTDPFQMEYLINQHVINIEVIPENSKTDINSAKVTQLVEALVQLDWEVDQARILAERIIDWRDGNRERSDLGMEDSDYFELGKPYGAKDKRIDDLIELKLMTQMDHQDFQNLTRQLTVYGRGAGNLFTIVAHAHDPKSNRSFVTSTTVQLTYQSGKPYRVVKWRYNQV